MLTEKLKSKAVAKGLLEPNRQIDLEKAFLLVRDMPYARANSRQPETIIEEWRGTCSGKHYLLKQLFAELGYSSKLIACSTVEQIDPQSVPEGKLRELLKQSNGRFVDVHNYLVLDTPQGEMIVDATWPISTDGAGTVVNQSFQMGVDQKIACDPLERWEIPENQDPQAFKDKILNENFTPEELAHREDFIQAMGEIMIDSE
jgi:hypothetical protein